MTNLPKHDKDNRITFGAKQNLWHVKDAGIYERCQFGDIKKCKLLKICMDKRDVFYCIWIHINGNTV